MSESNVPFDVTQFLDLEASHALPQGLDAGPIDLTQDDDSIVASSSEEEQSPSFYRNVDRLLRRRDANVGLPERPPTPESPVYVVAGEAKAVERPREDFKQWLAVPGRPRFGRTRGGYQWLITWFAPQGYSWCWPEIWWQFRELLKPFCDAFSLADEICPKTGRHHVQGCVWFRHPISLGRCRPPLAGERKQVINADALPQFASMGHIHWSWSVSSTPQECLKYITGGHKDKPMPDNLNHWGKVPPANLNTKARSSSQGSRTDLAAVKAAALSGMTLYEFMLSDLSNTAQALAAFPRYSSVLRQPKLMGRTLEVIWTYGPPGCCKSQSTREVMANFHSGVPYCIADSSKWFCTYSGQPLVLFEDLGPDSFKSVPNRKEFILNLFDRYEMNVQQKCIIGGTIWQPRWIYCTSNLTPQEFAEQVGFSEVHQAAFVRRITHVFTPKCQSTHLPQ